MRESERTVYETATHGKAPERGICRQLVSDPARYSHWYARHEHCMRLVGRLLRRESQLLELRRVCVEQLHRAALVRYLRDCHASSEERDSTLRLFYGVTDPYEAAVLEHRDYLVAASSQLCATALLTLAGDTYGVELIRRYETAYAQYFSVFCELGGTKGAGEGCLLGDLLPEMKDAATALRLRIVGGHVIPSRTTTFTVPRRAPRSAALRASN
jgi:hypothetical protein